MTEEQREALRRAKARLDTLTLYPRPVRIDPVRILVLPLFFRLPRLRRYHGYALWRTILLRQPLAGTASDDLLTHELCHIWQGQHRKVHMTLTYLTNRYRDNPYEREARRAVSETRSARAATPAATPAGSVR